MLNRNLGNVNIGEYLYSRKEVMENNKIEKQKLTEKSMLEMHSEKKVNKKSEVLFEKKKVRKFEEIFDTLDSDKDGVINASEIDIDTINPDILVIINELLVEMEEKGKTLDRSSFTHGMLKF